LITSKDWDKIRYKKYRKVNANEINSLTGIDSESYDTGEPFLICLSTGESLEPKNFIKFFSSQDRKGHYAVYNLKYDSGSFIYHLPEKQKLELWEKNFTNYQYCHIEYIPHKCLKLKYRKSHTVYFWDILQYYKSSLDNAAKTYLDESKIELETKKFTKKYVEKNLHEIKKYCIHDAILTAKLAMFLVKKLSEFGIRTTALYSSASLSFVYYADTSRKIVTVQRYWQHYPELLKIATDSYEGGKFEITSRGSFYGYEYDIVSAYPYEIMNLVDISLARVIKSKEHIKDADYGFLKVKILNRGESHIPCGIMIKNVRIYPAGELYLTITKNEYEYMLTLPGVSMEILDAYWLVVKVKKCPYKKTTESLFTLKDKYKKQNDRMLTNVSKLMLNSFYGKMAQIIEDYKGNLNAGIGWNPIYASVITANCRIKVCKIQNELKEKCLAVHTDSVITTCKLDEKYLQSGIGNFKLEIEGKGLLIACGQYELYDKSAFKGFAPMKDDTWKKILSRNENKSVIEYPIVKVESWIEAVAKGHFDKINYFSNEVKKININIDQKRTWLKHIKCKELLDKLELSLPKIVNEELPEDWEP